MGRPMIASSNKQETAIAPGVVQNRRSLLKDCSGATALEFAVVAAPFMALILANLETSIALFSQQLLDTTTETMSRQLMTGAEQSAGTSQSQFKQKICDDLPDFMSCSKVMVDVRSASEFSAANTSAATLTYDANGEVNNNWKYDLGQPGDVVVMQTYYLWPAVTGPLGFGLANLPSGERLLVSTAIFRTEKFE